MDGRSVGGEALGQCLPTDPAIQSPIHSHPSNREYRHTDTDTHPPANLGGKDIGMICHPLYPQPVVGRWRASRQQLTWHQSSLLLHISNIYVICITQQTDVRFFPPLVLLPPACGFRLDRLARSASRQVHRYRPAQHSHRLTRLAYSACVGACGCVWWYLHRTIAPSYRRFTRPSRYYSFDITLRRPPRPAPPLHGPPALATRWVRPHAGLASPCCISSPGSGHPP